MVAAVGWGLQYVLIELVLKKMSTLAFLAISSTVSMVVLWSVWFITADEEKKTILSVLNSPQDLGLILGAIALAIVANLGICICVGESGATYASIIEISYPLFVLLFSWMIFKSPVDNLGWFLTGSAMVLGGIAIIILKSKGA